MKSYEIQELITEDIDRIYLINLKENYIEYKNQKEEIKIDHYKLIKQLPWQDFIKIDKHLIINLNHVSRCIGNQLCVNEVFYTIESKYRLLTQQFNYIGGIKRLNIPHFTKHLFIHQGNEYLVHKYTDIPYIKASGSYSEIIIRNNKSYILSMNISTLSNNLCKTHFLRINRSIIINISQIKSYNHTFIWLKGINEPVSISRIKKDEILRLLNLKFSY